jgi:hypothetical protein
MKSLANRTFQVGQTISNIILLVICFLPFLFSGLLLYAYVTKYFDFPFLFLIIILPFVLMYNYVMTAQVELTSDSFGLKFNVTKSGLLMPKGETAFVWSSLKSFSKKEGRRGRTHLLLRWEGGKSHRLSGEDHLVLYEYLQHYFADKETKSSWAFM